MIYILWEFQVSPEKCEEFERYYSSTGRWAELFRKSGAFKETTLAQDPDSPGRYLTIDVWEDWSSFEAFKQKFRDEYGSLDHYCKRFTVEQYHIGVFEGK